MDFRSGIWASLVLGLAGASVIAAPASAAEVNFMGYIARFEDNYKKAVIEPFEQETGIKVNYIAAGNSAEQIAILRSQKDNPQVDLSIIDVSVARSGNQEGIFAEVDPSIVTNMADLNPVALANKPYGPGVTFDYVGMLYNTDRVPTPPTAIADLWGPDYKGEIAWAAGTMDMLMPLIAYNKSLGGDYMQNIDLAIDKLAELAPSVQTFAPAPDVYTVVMNGTAKVGFGWNSFAQYYADLSKGKLGIVAPKEGTVFQINTLNLVKGGPNPKEAQEFMNYALRPDVQARFSALMAYAPTNTKAELPPEILERTAVRPDILEKTIPLDWTYLASKREGWNNEIRRRAMSQ
ncbi:MAG: ABC transporter substrate-binding protein [Rhizobiaceae bacterium]|nr:ABC transporter substrate-binding protein [Rhizobiaceae bacterium]